MKHFFKGTEPQGTIITKEIQQTAIMELVESYEVNKEHYFSELERAYVHFDGKTEEEAKNLVLPQREEGYFLKRATKLIKEKYPLGKWVRQIMVAGGMAYSI